MSRSLPADAMGKAVCPELREADVETRPGQTQAGRDPLGSGWMVVAAVFFAVMGALAKKAGQEYAMGYNELVFWRTVFAVAALGALALWRGERFATPHIGAHISRGVSGTLGLLLFFYALTQLSLATATTLTYTSAIFLALLSFVRGTEKIGGRALSALLLGFCGIVLLLRPSFAAGQEWAGLLGLGAGFCAGWAYFQVRELSQRGEPGWRVVFYFSCVAAAISGVWASADGWHTPSAASLLHALGIGASATVAQLCLTRAYRVGRTFVAASLSYLTVVFSSLLGVWWLGDTLHWQEVLGMGIIVASGMLGAAKR